jgi:Uma2 family endonuclease
MTPIASPTPIDLYPSGDGQPVAETFDHLYAILMTIELLRLYLSGQQATVLGNQYLYYSQGYPKLRIAPDVMVIFDVAPGGRDNYKIWEEGAIPRVAFDVSTPLNIKITSPSTRNQDEGFKKDLYEQMGIQEYWQFDPKAQWIPGQLRGYQLVQEVYQPISNNISLALGLRLEPADTLISFYRLDSGAKLLLPSELQAGWEQEAQYRAAAEAQLEQETQFRLAIAAQLEQETQSRLVSAAKLEQETSARNAAEAKLAEYESRFGKLTDQEFP